MGAAHLGVLQKLAEQGKAYDYIIGVSAGALAGALMADGRTPEDSWQIIRQTKLLSLFRDMTRGFGIVSGKKIHALIDKIFEGKTFADLKIPFKVGATDFASGEFVEIDSGSLADQA